MTIQLDRDLAGYLGARDRQPITQNQRGRLALARGPQQWRKPPISLGLRMRGDVRRDLLESTLTWLARRHSALRTYFPETEPEGFARCADPATISWAVQEADLRAVPAAERIARTQQVHQRLHESFAAAQFPLFRAYLLRSSDECDLLLSIDHLVFDGASVPFLLADFQHIYQHLAAGGDPDQLSRVVSDSAWFSGQEHAWMQSAEAPEALVYWTRVWADFGPFPTTNLPPSGTGPTAGSGAVWRQELRSADVRTAQRSFSGGHLSLPALTSAAVLAALRDVTGQSECGLLHSSSRRFVDGCDDLIGYLNNRVLLRAETPNTASFEEVAQLTRMAMLESLEFAMMPFEVLLDQLAPQLSACRPDRRYVHLNVEKTPAAPILPGLDVSFFWPPQDSTHNDLPWIGIDLEDSGDRIILSAGYSTAHHDPQTVADLMIRTRGYLTGGEEKEGTSIVPTS